MLIDSPLYLTAKRASGLGCPTGCRAGNHALDLENFEVDLRYGLFPGPSNQVLRGRQGSATFHSWIAHTMAPQSRAFGIGGNHSLDIYPVGDTWPFTWMNFVLEDGGRALNRRWNWAYGHGDARLTTNIDRGSFYSESTITWAGVRAGVRNAYERVRMAPWSRRCDQRVNRRTNPLWDIWLKHKFA